MPHHRLAFFFLDEQPTDFVAWQAWIEAALPRLRAAVTLGERRPFVQVAAPFAHRHPITTPRAEEVDGLELVECLLDQLVALSRAAARSIGLLLLGQPFGGVRPDGRDPAVSAGLDEWRRLLAARPPDEPDWEREGWVSIWAGTLLRDDHDRLLAERYGTDAPSRGSRARSGSTSTITTSRELPAQEGRARGRGHRAPCHSRTALSLDRSRPAPTAQQGATRVDRNSTMSTTSAATTTSAEIVR